METPVQTSLPSALKTARAIMDLRTIVYPTGIRSPKVELNANARQGKFRYDRDFLLQFMPICKERPRSLPPLDALGLEPVDTNYPARLSYSTRHASSTTIPRATLRINSGSITFGSTEDVDLPISSSPITAPAPVKRERAKMFGSMAAYAPVFVPTHSTSSSASTPNADMALTSTSAPLKTAKPDIKKLFEGPSSSGPASTASSPAPTDVASPSPRSSALPGTSSGSSGMGQGQGAPPPHGSQPSQLGIAPAPVKREHETPEVVDHNIHLLLDELTMEHFDSVSEQIIQCVNKSENEKNGRTLIRVIRLVFEKAIEAETNPQMCALLYHKIMEQISPKVRDEGTKNAEGRPTAGSQLLRKYVLNRCQEDFKRGWVVEMTCAAAEVNAKAEAGKDDKEDDGFQKAKCQRLALVKFIGELFNQRILPERIIRDCIKTLLANAEQMEDVELESLCELLKTSGKLLDTPKAQSYMGVYFSRINNLARDSSVSSRLQSMLLVRPIKSQCITMLSACL
ncbi:ARM repeat-containing protein [Obba rivulosa]|uniref:ARM repeat-containing protein n=1 Tax=Obba rivulosa TaxID=1052685 RepID=A0A8E2DL12_9APHY|nr:ARM repeat-containing protein [Obba rivulosa]